MSGEYIRTHTNAERSKIKARLCKTNEKKSLATTAPRSLTHKTKRCCTQPPSLRFCEAIFARTRGEPFDVPLCVHPERRQRVQLLSTKARTFLCVCVFFCTRAFNHTSSHTHRARRVLVVVSNCANESTLSTSAAQRRQIFEAYTRSQARTRARTRALTI